MSISFEEITGEVVAERPREQAAPEARESAAGIQLAERIRAVLARERRRVERLSDQ